MQASFVNMKKYYKNSQYKRVLREAKRSTAEYKNPKLHLLWGKSAEALNLPTEAMAAYERVLMLDEDNSEAKISLKKIYQATDRGDLSVNNIGEPNPLEDLHINSDISLGYDTNLNASAGGDALDKYYGVSGNSGKVSSSFAMVNALAEYTYRPISNDRLFIKGVASLYAKTNFSAKYYNMYMATVELGIGYESDSYSFYMPIDYNKIHYLDKDLMDRYRLLPRVFIPIYADSFLDVSAEYTHVAYIDTIDKNSSSNTKGLGIGLFIPMDENMLHINSKYQKRISDNNLPNRYVDADFITLSTNYKYMFSPAVSLEVEYLFRYGNYDDDIGTTLLPSLTKRVDYLNQLDVKLKYMLKKNREIFISNRYTNNSSNYTPGVYSKNVFMLGASLKF